MDLPAELIAKDCVDEAVLLDPGVARKRLCGDGCLEVVVAAGVSSARAPGIAASMRCLISSVVGIGA